MKAIRNLNYPKDRLEVILVGRKSYRPKYAGIKTIAPDVDQFPNSVGLNFGIRHTNPKSKYIWILSDDTIPTRGSLENLTATAGDLDIILNPITPSESGNGYALHFPVIKLDGTSDHAIFKRKYRLEDVKSHIKDMINTPSIYPVGVINKNYLRMFATLIPRKVWNKVGMGAPDKDSMVIGFDESMWAQDIDYSFRASKYFGVTLADCLPSLVWHFSGISLDVPLEEPQRRTEGFMDKWGFRLQDYRKYLFSESIHHVERPIHLLN